MHFPGKEETLSSKKKTFQLGGSDLNGPEAQ
jgi:hypothetical protein